MKKIELSDSEKYLWQYVNDHLDEIPKLSITKLSERSNVSTATIVRTLKKQGYEGYTAFKHTLKNSSHEELQIADAEIKKIINKNKIEAVNTIANLKSDTIEDTIQTLQKTDRIFIFARGFSEWIAREMAIKFQLLNKYCEVHDDPNIIKLRSQSIKNTDVVIFISLSGETDELVIAAQNCQKNGTHTITLTTNSDSRLARYSDTLFVGYKSKNSYIPDYEVHSRLPLSIIGRIIVDSYIIRTENH